MQTQEDFLHEPRPSGTGEGDAKSPPNSATVHSVALGKVHRLRSSSLQWELRGVPVP